MGLAEIFFHAWGAGFSGAVMPGPLLAVDIRESYRRGAWAGSLLVLGHALLETVLVVGLVWGLDRWIRLEVTRGILGLLGGGLLLWMAWGCCVTVVRRGWSLRPARILLVVGCIRCWRGWLFPARTPIGVCGGPRLAWGCWFEPGRRAVLGWPCSWWGICWRTLFGIQVFLW